MIHVTLYYKYNVCLLFSLYIFFNVEFSNSNTSSVVVTVSVTVLTHMIIFLNISFGQSGCRLALPPISVSLPVILCLFMFAYYVCICLPQWLSFSVFISLCLCLVL